MSKKERRPQTPKNRPTRSDSARPIAGLRIIGGQLRGRKLHYSGDLRTRPMKDRLREAVFNLIGPSIRGTHAVDLFAGTGALGLEAISRGAERATLIEQHHPTAAIIRQNIAALGLQEQAEVIVANAFLWRRTKGSGVFSQDSVNDQHPPSEKKDSRPLCAWTVFCSPPYDFYIDRGDEMRELMAGLIRSAPPGSVFVVEADARFDFQTLPDPQAWDVRPYSPAVVGIYRKE